MSSSSSLVALRDLSRAHLLATPVSLSRAQTLLSLPGISLWIWAGLEQLQMCFNIMLSYMIPVRVERAADRGFRGVGRGAAKGVLKGGSMTISVEEAARDWTFGAD